MPSLEGVLVEARERHAHVLPGARQVGELEVDHPRLVALGEVEHVLRRCGSPSPDERAHVSGSVVFAVDDIGDRHAVSSCRGAMPIVALASTGWRKARPGIFDTGTKTPRPHRTTIPVIVPKRRIS